MSGVVQKRRNRTSAKESVLCKYPSAVCERTRNDRYRVSFRTIGTPSIYGDTRHHAWALAERWMLSGKIRTAGDHDRPAHRVGGYAMDCIISGFRELKSGTQSEIAAHCGYSETHVLAVLRTLVRDKRATRSSEQPYVYRFGGGL